MATAAVRPAEESDVDEIVRVQAVTWRTAYAEILPAAALDQLTSPAARERWADAVAAARSAGGARIDTARSAGGARIDTARSAGGARIETGDGYHVFVATEGEAVVGFCAAARYAGQEAASIAEIGTLLVEPRWARRGHGGRLLAVAAAALRTGGGEHGRVWVPEPDAASRGFYSRAGWAPDGAARTLDTGDGTVRELRFTGSLDLDLVR